MRNFFAFIAVSVIAAQGFGFGLSGANAQETPWQDHDGYIQTRVVAASKELSGNTMLYAWQARLQPGWKTYWRSPGEAGLPVVMQVDGKTIEQDYPLPERFELFGIETFGYSDAVVMPFELPAGAGNPVSLQSEFMICKDVCIPYTATYKLDKAMVDAAGPAQDILISSWQKKVPAREGAGTVDFEIDAVKIVGTPGRQRLVVEVSGDRVINQMDLMVESSIPGVYFSKPDVRLLGDGRQARLVVTAMGGRGGVDLKDESVRLTLTDGSGAAIDRSINLASGR